VTMTRVCVIGLGYIGLPIAALAAGRGMRVFGVDVDGAVVAGLNAGRSHVLEPELAGLVARVVAEGRLTGHGAPQPADVFIIAVPTPLAEGRRPMLEHMHAALRALAPVLVPGNLVILESTSPVGTTAGLGRMLAVLRPDLRIPGQADGADIALAYCPERVLPGRILAELVENDRCVGGITPACAAAAAWFYARFVRGEVLRCDAATAELVKLTENAFRDVNIAFANELSMICDELDINVWELTALANRHPRVNILQPGPGVGGHCIAVDPWFIVDTSPKHAKLIRTAREVNDSKPQWVIEKTKDAILKALAEMPTKRMSDIKVACLGLAFKPNIDDLRESPALGIAKHLSQMGCEVMAVEPHLETTPLALLEHNISLRPLQTALWHADVVCVLVKHQALIDEVDMIQSHTAVVDAVGLLH